MQTAGGKLLVGGHQLTPTIPSSQPVVRLEADGSLDADFDASDLEGETDCWAIQDDGRIVLGGKFYKRNEYVFGDVVRIDSNGALDESFAPYKFNWNVHRYYTWVHAIVLQPDGKALVGGGIYGPYPWIDLSYYALARLDSNGELDTYLNDAFDSPTGVRSVEALAEYADGRIIVGGTLLP